MSISSQFSQALDWFIPDNIRQNPMDYSRARNIIGATLLAACFVPIFSINYFKLGHTAMGGGILTAGVLTLLAAFAMKITGALALVREYAIAVFLGMVVWMCYVNGGIESSSAPWFLLVPIAAIFIGGTRSGAVWTFLSLMFIVLFYLAHKQGWAIPKSPLGPELHPQLQFRSLLGLTIVIYALALVFELGKVKSFARTEAARLEAENEHAAMESLLVEVKSAVARASSESTQINTQSDQISRTMVHQAGETEQMARLVEEIAGLTIQNAQQSSQAAQEADRAGQQASEGGRAMDSTLSNLTRAVDSVENATSKIDELGRRSDEIGSIVQVIREIADQTNLLALNAAIEAARAGEQGRGFAVVADEVRKLAERTSSATREIEEKIGLILAGTREAMTAMQAGSERMSDISQSAAEAGEHLNEIIAGTQRLTQLTNTVARNEARQSEQFQAIATDIAELRADMASASDATQSIAQAVSNLDQTMRGLDQSVRGR
ncbi:methyl-accepting chemotaxis protein [Chitinimonas sp. BJYL2]|uniref:methyl-accepting chemotaxis protein n=1 Tax=Chitinimonas sp. BJYL2 TaxID=2976696 RepID=UPI0022B3BEF1|nr:methyl-accepting chemotaxis protein [Chitinimonas sp. BJYL2]